jgi:hypothetical protein
VGGQDNQARLFWLVLKLDILSQKVR